MKKIYFSKYIFLLLFVCLCNWVMAQSGTVSGRIIDESNQPLPGATVALKGTSLSTATDVNGYFKLSNSPSGAQVLVVKFIGYEPLEQPVTVTGNITTNVKMQ